MRRPRLEGKRSVVVFIIHGQLNILFSGETGSGG